MERTIALKKLGQLLGKKMGYRVDANAPTPEEREAASVELTTAVAERKAVIEKKEARLRAILDSDTEYQALKAASEAARKRVDRLGSMTRHYKITVGTSEGLFFRVVAQGDTWEEILDELAPKKKVA